MAVLAAEKVVPVHVPEGQLVSPAEPPSKRLAALLKKAAGELRAHQLWDAETHFRQAYSVNSESYEAIEGLAHVALARGDQAEAVRQLTKARQYEPLDRLAGADGEIGDIYSAQNRWPEAEAAYRNEVLESSDPVSPSMDLGLSIYKQRRFREAEIWFHRAEMGLEAAPKGERAALEPMLHLLLSQCYANLNWPRYAISEAQDALATERTVEVRSTARRVEDDFDRPQRRFTVSLMGQYDTNVLPPFSTIENLNGTQAIGGGAVLTRVGLELHSSPARRWSFGLDYTSALDIHAASALSQFDTWVNVPTVWVAWWNLHNTELKLFFDYSNSTMNRDSMNLYLQTLGPELVWRFFWDKRHEVSAGYSLKRNYFPGDPPEAPVNTFNQQSGLEHRAFLRGSFAGPTPFVQPFVQYTFDDNESDGKNYYALINSIEAGLSLWPWGGSRMILSGSYSHVDFPENVNRRADRIGRVRAGVELPLSKRLMASVEADFTASHSNLHSQFLYDRIIVNSGLTYALPF